MTLSCWRMISLNLLVGGCLESMTLTHGLVKRRWRNCLGPYKLIGGRQHGCFNEGATHSAQIELCQELAPTTILYHVDADKCHCHCSSWCHVPLSHPLLLLFGELALLTLSKWSCVSAKWKNFIIFMPVFQTPGEPASPHPRPLSECYMGKRQAVGEITGWS